MNNYGPPAVPTNLMIQGLPYRAPPAPQIPCRQHMAQHLAAVHGHLLNQLQIEANKNPLRANLYWTIVNQNYMNQGYAELLLSAMEYAEFLMASQAGTPDQCIQIATTEMCAMKAAQLATTHPSLMQQLNRDGQMHVQQLLDHFNAVGQNVESYLYSNPAPAVGQQQQPMYNNNYGNNNGYQNNGYQNEINVGNVGVNDMWGGGNNRRPVMQTRQSGTQFNTNLFNESHHVPGDSGQRRSCNLKAKPQQNNNQQEKVMEPVMEREVVVEDKPMRVLASAGNSKLSFDDQPHPTLYNPITHVMYHLVNGKSVTEQLEERTVDYNAHETEFFFPTLTAKKEDIQRDRAAAANAFKKVLAEKDVQLYLQDLADENEIIDLDNKISEAVKTCYEYDEILVTDNPNSIATTCLNKLADFEISDSALADNCIKWKYVIIEPVRMSGECAVKFMEAGNSNDYTVLRERIQGMISSGASPLLTNNLIKIVTDMINEICTIRFGIVFTMDSFLLDIEDLRKAILKKYGVRISDKFDATCKEVAKQCFSYLKASEMYDSVPRDSDDIVATRHGLAVSVPLLSKDFIANVNGRYASVMESRFPELHAAIANVFSDADEKVRYVTFITRDGETLKLYKSLMTDTYLISK